MSAVLPIGFTVDFRNAMDAAGVGIWVSNTDLHRVWFNRHWLDFKGRSLEQEAGNGWLDGIHADDRNPFLRSYAECVESRRPFRLQYRMRRSDGQFRWLEDSGVPRLGVSGALLGYVGTALEIHGFKEKESELNSLSRSLQNEGSNATEASSIQATAFKRAEVAAIESSQYFSILVNGVKDYALFMINVDGYIASWNTGAQTIKRYAAEDILGKHYRVFFSEEAQETKVPEKILSLAAQDGRYESEDWRYRADGTRFWAHAVLDAIYDNKGALLGFAKITRDITERMQTKKLVEEARERLAQVQKMEAIGQLTGGIAHDFNNLLTVILGNSEILESKLVQDPRLRSLAEMTRMAAERGAALTGRLLAFARRQPLDPKPTDLGKMLTDADGPLRRSIGEQIEIEVMRSGGLWPALVDLKQFESTLLNLCINARDAMPSGGKLTIEVANATLDEDYATRHNDVAAGQYVMLAVSDTGIGMNPTTLARAFEPFYTTKESDKASGLGLSMVYGFMKQLKGHISLYSEVDHGTTIKLYFPRADEPTFEVEGEKLLRHSGRILLVEDDDLVRLHVSTQLRGLGYEVLSARNGNEGLTMLQTNDRIDLLFTDIVMPGGINGRQLAEQATKLRPRLKVLFTSGYTENSLIHNGRLELGVQLLSKPYRREELYEKVRSAMSGADPR